MRIPLISDRIVIPWLTVRKVPVEITVVSMFLFSFLWLSHMLISHQPSPRTAVVKLQRGIQQGLLGRISRSSVMEYHGFGIISEGVESGCHYMIVGVQGDWTRSIANDPPKYIWTRQMKVRSFFVHMFRPLFLTSRFSAVLDVAFEIRARTDSLRACLISAICTVAESASAQDPGLVPSSRRASSSITGSSSGSARTWRRPLARSCSI